MLIIFFQAYYGHYRSLHDKCHRLTVKLYSVTRKIIRKHNFPSVNWYNDTSKSVTHFSFSSTTQSNILEHTYILKYNTDFYVSYLINFSSYFSCYPTLLCIVLIFLILYMVNLHFLHIFHFIISSLPLSTLISLILNFIDNSCIQDNF